MMVAMSKVAPELAAATILAGATLLGLLCFVLALASERRGA